MASVLALVSKGLFQRDHGKKVSPGDVLGFDAYHSKHKTFHALDDAGDLFLVTVLPDDVLWLVAVLRRPQFHPAEQVHWAAPTNTVPVTVATSLVGQLRFSTGKGITAGPGKLGMSLQTPRQLTADDVALFEALLGTQAPSTTPQTGEHGALDLHGLRCGLWRCWRQDGSLKWEKQMRHGLAHGLVRWFHPDGTVGIETTIEDGVQQSTEHTVGTGPTDLPGFEVVPETVSRWTWISRSSGRYHTLDMRDAQGRALDSTGALLPSRPASVHPDALLLHGEEDHWQLSAYEHGTGKPIGLQTAWTLLGEPLFQIQIDDAGRRRWSAPALSPHPRDEALKAFKEATEYAFQPIYGLMSVWDPELHAVMMAWLPAASAEAVTSYAKGLGERGWLRAYATPDGWLSFSKLQLDVIDHFRGRDPTPPPALLVKMEALADRLGEDDIRSGRPGLHRLLSKGNEALLLDDTDRAYWRVGDDTIEAPLVVDTHRGSFAKYLLDADGIDERRLFWSGKNVWWVLYRFGTSLMLQGSTFFPERDQGEVILDAFIRCPDPSWTEKVTRLFLGTKPKGAKEVDPHFMATTGWAFAYSYQAQASKDEALGRSFSRLVHNDKVWSGAGSPGVLRLHMLDKDGRGPIDISSHSTHEAAIQAMQQTEFKALAMGYALKRVVNLPVVEVAEAPKVKKPRKVGPANIGEVASEVGAELSKALQRQAAGDLEGAVSSLLDAWRKRPAPALADALDALSAQAPPFHQAVGRSKQARAAWDEAESKGSVLHLPALTKALPEANSQEVASRMERLALWPADPRVDRGLLEVAWSIPFTSSGSKPAWRRIFKRITLCRDGRVLARLRGLDERYESAWDTQAGEWARGEVAKIIAASGATLEALAALDLSDADASMAKALATPPAAAPNPLDSVFQDPLTDSKRIALADRLSTPRGEIIKLQAMPKRTRDQTKRLNALLKEHLNALAGPLASMLVKQMKTRLGFVSQAKLRGDADFTSDAASSPYWSTVEVLDIAYNEHALPNLKLPALRELAGLGAPWQTEESKEWLAFIEQVPADRLERLQASATWEEGLLLADRLDELPALQHLELTITGAPVDVPVLPDAFDRLESFCYRGTGGRMSNHTNQQGEWVKTYDRRQVNLYTALLTQGRDVDLGLDLELSEYYAPIRFRWTRRDRQLTVLAGRSGGNWWESYFDQICGVLLGVGPDVVSTAQLVVSPPDKEAFIAIIERIAGRSGLTLDLSKVK